MSKQAMVLCHRRTATWARNNEPAARGAEAVVLFPRYCEDVWCVHEILVKLPSGSVEPDP